MMMNFVKKINKFKLVMLITLLVSMFFVVPTFAIFVKHENGKIYWANEDGTYEKGGWRLIDEDKDSIGYYYYFDNDGFVLIDDITPDYQIVDRFGRKIDQYGNQISEKIEVPEYFSEELDGYGVVEIYNEEIMQEIMANQAVATVESGYTSSGNAIYVKEEEDEGPRPSDNLVVEKNPDGTAMRILAPGVVLKEKKETKYDVTIDKHMTEYIKSGAKYSKKVNGTTFLKTKWKNCMSMKGTGATVVFENPKNNFNKLKGRIATHYFTYTDRTTQCTLSIINEDTGEEIDFVNGFNYNGGCRFECTFPKKTKAIRFELEVSGQYTTRVCYLRDLEYGFDREAYEEELYDDEIEAELRIKFGTESEADYVDIDEEDPELDGEWSIEGIDPFTRYRMEHNMSATESDARYYYDDTYDVEEELAKEAEKSSPDDAITGPAFDKELKSRKEAVGPLGAGNIFSGKYEGD